MKYFMDWARSRVVGRRNCRVPVGNARVTDIVFADDTVTLVESLGIMAFDASVASGLQGQDQGASV